jgi:hypothetical protein
MLQRTNKLLIGKDIARDAQATAATTFAALILSSALQAGEVIVLDKNKIPLAAGSTVSDSDVIFICQGTGTTYTYTQPGGSSITAIKVLISDPIEAGKVKSYKGVQYAAKSEQVMTFTPTGTVTTATEYVLRIVYKDMPEHPGQFTQTYRYTTTSNTVKNLLDGLTPVINGHKGARVIASDNDAVLTLTGKEVPEGTTSLSDIDEFKMVEFDAFLNYVDSNGRLATLASTIANTPAEYGSGNWEQVRDLEKAQLGYIGVQNKIHFPVITPDFNTVKDAYYDLIVIEHDRSYLSPDNQYIKQAPLTTIVALATASTGINAAGQSAEIVGILNTWMASTPGAFAPISL